MMNSTDMEHHTAQISFQEEIEPFELCEWPSSKQSSSRAFGCSLFMMDSLPCDEEVEEVAPHVQLRTGKRASLTQRLNSRGEVFNEYVERTSDHAPVRVTLDSTPATKNIMAGID
jgi:hypothetical protein